MKTFAWPAASIIVGLMIPSAAALAVNGGGSSLRNGSLQIAIVEGVTVSKINVTGNTVLKTPAITAAMKLKQGTTFSKKQLQDDLKAIELSYAHIGYSATAHGAPEPSNPSVIDVAICEAHVGAIDIAGTSKTRDNVIRRLVRTKPGDLVSESGLRGDYMLISNTHDFKTVDLTTKPFGKKCGYVTVVWTVTDKS